jgi:hypothetical protein
MTINEERDIILNALYHHFDRHRTNASDLEEYLTNNTDIRPDRIYPVLDDLKSSKYVNEILTMNFHDFNILPKGESLMDDGGFSNRKLKEKPISTVSIHTGGGDIIGSNILNQDFVFDGKMATTNETTTINKKVNPTDKPDGWLKKMSIFWNSVIGKLIIGVLIGTILWFVKFYLDKQYAITTIHK